jgi:hypothetical protein
VQVVLVELAHPQHFSIQDFKHKVVMVVRLAVVVAEMVVMAR